MSNLVHQPNYLIAQLPEQYKSDPAAIQAIHNMVGNDALIAQYLRWCDEQKGLRGVQAQPVYYPQPQPNYYQQPPQYYPPAPIVQQAPPPPPQIIYVQVPPPEPQPQQYAPPPPPVVHQTHITKVYEGGSDWSFAHAFWWIWIVALLCGLMALVESRPALIIHQSPQEVYQ